jgi:hypothetical protein
MSQTMSEIEQLERILTSAQLVTSPSLSRFLRYIVEETVAGRSAEIREYTLGVHVFDRGDDFNPRLDPIVRVQARNLRSRMAKYYEGPGAEDAIRIELPKGTYVPIFHKNVVEEELRVAGQAAVAATQPEPVEVSPFATSIMPAPPPRSPVAEPRVPRFWIAAVILLVILIGIAALYLTQNQTAPHVSAYRTVAQLTGPWGILGA